MLVAHCKLKRRQAIIDIGIQPFPLEISSVSPSGQAPRFPVTKYRALIDTGAQRTCLTNSTIASEGLVRHGHKFIRNVHNEATHSAFMTLLGIYGSEGRDDGENEAPRSYFFIEKPVEIINIADNENFQAILGMDVLENYSFRFAKGGDFELDLT